MCSSEACADCAYAQEKQEAAELQALSKEQALQAQLTQLITQHQAQLTQLTNDHHAVQQQMARQLKESSRKQQEVSQVNLHSVLLFAYAARRHTSAKSNFQIYAAA